MIFVSVGSLLAFDRLVQAADGWAAANPNEAIHIQIGEGRYEPRHAPWSRLMPITEYRRLLQQCSLFVAHVGMGSILQGLEERKQMLLLPRLAARGEHTTDHQLETASRFRGMPGLSIVDDEQALQREMTRLLAEPLQVGGGIPDRASPELLANVGAFVRSAMGGGTGPKG
ncbi:glycosyltransferase [Sphingomonas sp.]|uniref:glycosyltransferase n=1 Tax=Sphingomonas sp. TaxID=28214 RepID=UPI0031DE1B3D